MAWYDNWNLFYTEDELNKARNKADEFAGIKYEQPTAGAIETLFPSNVTYDYQDGTRVENIIPIADKQVVNQQQTKASGQIPQVTNDNLLRTRPGNVDPNTGMVRQGPLTQQGLFDVPGSGLPKVPSLWQRLTTPIQGGRGTFDDPLFRALEYGSVAFNPASVQQKMGGVQGVTKQWAEAKKDAATAAATKAKSQASILAKNIDAAKVNDSTLLKMFMPDAGGFLGMGSLSKEEREKQAATLVTTYRSIASQLRASNPGVVVTHDDVIKAMKKLQGG